MIWDFIGPLVETSTNASQEDRTENSVYQMTLCEAGEAADCVTWVGMPACLLGTALSLFGSFGFTSRYRLLSPVRK
jgi:hypothetical protein